MTTTNSDDAADLEAVVRRYYAVVSDLGSTAADLEALLAADVLITEHPNPISPNGAVRDKDATLAGFAAGKALLRAQSFDVREIVVNGERAAVRAIWRATIGIDAGPFRAGQKLTAQVASWLTVRDGRIVAHETYDCYQPWSAPLP